MKKPLFSAALVTAVALSLLGCSAEAPEPEPAETTSTQQEASAPETPEAEEQQPPASGDSPEWAEGAVDVGEKLGGFTTDSWAVEVFQVGTAETTKDSMFVDKETGDNLLPAGAEVVYVNFVITNTSDADIQLGHSIASPELKSSTWKYMGGQPSFSDTAAYENLQLSSDAKQTGFDAPFVVAPGQTFAQASNIAYVPGDKVAASVRLTPVDDEGQLLHDKKEEGTVEVTIK